MAMLSKIARLPRETRDALNRRLDDGEPGSVILPWLNELAEVKKVLKDLYQGVEVSTQNLSAWRETGFAEWQERQTEHEFIKNATEFSKEVVNATGLQLTEGAAAIAAGALMTRIEDVRREQKAGADVDDKLFDLIEKLTSLRSGEIGRVQAEVAKDKQLLQREKHGTDKERLALEREKFEMLAAKALLKAATSKEIQKVVSGSGNHSEKIAALRALMFPRRSAA
jgi:hypothetical protein